MSETYRRVLAGASTQIHKLIHTHTHTRAAFQNDLCGCSGNLALLGGRFPLHYVSFFRSLQMLPESRVDAAAAGEHGRAEHTQADAQARTPTSAPTSVCTHRSSKDAHLQKEGMKKKTRAHMQYTNLQRHKQLISKQMCTLCQHIQYEMHRHIWIKRQETNGSPLTQKQSWRFLLLHAPSALHAQCKRRQSTDSPPRKEDTAA